MDCGYTFTLTENALKNLVSTYADHKVQKEKYLEDVDYDEYLLKEDIDYQFYVAYCHAAEEWMRAIGIHPESNFVTDIIEKEREGR